MKTRRHKKQRKTRSKKGGGPKRNAKKNQPQNIFTKDEEMQFRDMVYSAEGVVSILKENHNKLFENIMQELQITKTTSGSVLEEDENNTMAELSKLEFDLSNYNDRIDTIYRELNNFYTKKSKIYEELFQVLKMIDNLDERMVNAIKWVGDKAKLYHNLKRIIILKRLKQTQPSSSEEPRKMPTPNMVSLPPQPPSDQPKKMPTSKILSKKDIDYKIENTSKNVQNMLINLKRLHQHLFSNIMSTLGIKTEEEDTIEDIDEKQTIEKILKINDEELTSLEMYEDGIANIISDLNKLLRNKRIQYDEHMPNIPLNKMPPNMKKLNSELKEYEDWMIKKRDLYIKIYEIIHKSEVKETEHVFQSMAL